MNIPSWQNAIKTPWREDFKGPVSAMIADYPVFALDDHRIPVPVLMGLIVVRAVFILN